VNLPLLAALTPPDTFLFEGEEYSLIGISGGDLVLPQQSGMEPKMLHTACYRGFVATYEVTKEALYLRELTLAGIDKSTKAELSHFILAILIMAHNMRFIDLPPQKLVQIL